MPKHTHYELKLGGKGDVVAMLKEHLPAHHSTRAEANAKYRAILELFGDAVEVNIISVRRVPAKVIRRRLKVT
jgi:hypothetical protein